MKRILSLVRNAVQKYNMIKSGDTIGVGVSGGKDSIVTLHALNILKNFYPEKFTVKAIIIDSGFKGTDYTPIADYCKNQNIECHTEKTEIAEIVFEKMESKNPCSLCANMRRGALCNVAKELDCNKIALGHNRDDANETLLLNLFYNSRIYSFEPVTQYPDSGISIIRPIIFLSENQTRHCVKKFGLPIVKSTCPNDGFSQRERIKNLIEKECGEIPLLKKNLFSAIQNLEFYKKYESDREDCE